MEKELDPEIKQYLKEESEKWKEKAAKSQHYVHGFMIYQCEQCGAVYVMWLEKGIEDQIHDISTGNHKPTPFCICCPECYGTAKHVLWNLDTFYFASYRLLESGENFFYNDPDKRCGIAVIFQKDFDDLNHINTEFRKKCILGIDLSQGDDFCAKPTGEIHFEEGMGNEILDDKANRKDRRHPFGRYDLGYKRPRKNQKTNHYM